MLLALMTQLGMSSSVPTIDVVATAAALCHTDEDTGGYPSPAPSHSADCLICLLCGTLHIPAAVLVSDASVLKPPAVRAINRSGLPPPSTAPPAPHRPPSQPRAPPIFS